MLAIESLLKAKKDIDHIVIETSGMADPGPIVQKLWADEALECHAQLDGVVCLIDSYYGMQRLDPTSPAYSVEAAKQVALADMIILNKIDLIQRDKTLGALKSVLGNINPVALIDQTSYSKAPLNKVLNLGEYRKRGQNASLDLLATMNLSASHSINSADRKMRNFTIFLPGSNLNLERFERWLFTLLWENKITVNGIEYDLSPIDLMRVKGLLTVKDEFYALQVVQSMYDLTPLSSRPADFTPHSRLVFIGVVPTEQEELIKDSFMQMIFS
jgi:G3E family GTPase